MNVDYRRSRMVTFRVSTEEYQSLEEACVSRRVRSISELARSAMQQWIGQACRSNPVEVERRIQVLAEELERLQQLVQRQKAMSSVESTQD
ncbi:MAG: hypothetical protein ABSH56_06340 [Bryobacteraceae bacterium]